MADSTASRADKVAELVQKLKRGEITKGEMFQQLSALSKPAAAGASAPASPEPQQASSGARQDEAPPGDDGSPKVGKVHAGIYANTEYTHFNVILQIQTESRQSMMQRLLDEKRRARHGNTAPVQHTEPATAPVPPTPEQPVRAEGPESEAWTRAPPLPQSSHSSLPENEMTASSEQHAPKSEQDVAPPQLPAGFPPPPPPPPNVDVAAYYAAYAAAIAQASQSQMMMDDNDSVDDGAPPFEQSEGGSVHEYEHDNAQAPPAGGDQRGTPHQEDTPSHSNPTRARRLSARKAVSGRPPRASSSEYTQALQALDAVPFEERQRQWRAHKDAERQRRAAEKEAAELQECTFKPNTNVGGGGAGASEGGSVGGRGAPGSAQARRRRVSGASSVGSRESGVPIHERLFSAETPATRAKRRERIRGNPAQQQSFDAGADGEGDAAGTTLQRAEWVSVPTSQGKPSRMTVAARSAGGHKNAVPSSEDKELEECTFKPKVQPNRGRLSATPVRSKYLEHFKGGSGASEGAPPGSARSASAAKKRPPIPSGLEECTFKPKVNATKVDAAYASQNVFQRLASAPPRSRPSSAARARPGTASAPGSARRDVRSSSARRNSRTGSSSAASSPSRDEQRVGVEGPPVMDVQGFLAAMGGPTAASGGDASAQGATHQRKAHHRASAASSVTGGSSGSSSADTSPARSKGGKPLPREEYEKRFQSFLERQNAAHRNRERKLEQTKSQLQPTHRPQLCSKSLELIEKNASGSFLDRISKGAVRQEQHALQQRAAVSMDPECTFAPRINPSSRKRPPRSAAEMSVGDALKRETAVRLMRLRAEQEELDGATFKPAINPASAAAGGRLRIQDDPDNYVRRVAEAAAVAEKRTRLARLESSRAELQECTFKPQVHDAPMFVKRIARSMALTKAVHPPPSEESKKPEWR